MAQRLAQTGPRTNSGGSGFDYDALGTRSVAHFAVVIYSTLAAAYDRRAMVVEYRVGAHQTKPSEDASPAPSPATS
jgi:hypothetical protein